MRPSKGYSLVFPYCVPHISVSNISVLFLLKQLQIVVLVFLNIFFNLPNLNYMVVFGYLDSGVDAVTVNDVMAVASSYNFQRTPCACL